MQSEMLEITPGQIYRHFKGNLYKVIALATDSETGEKVVVYEAQYGANELYVRPYAMFAEKLDAERYPEAKQEYRFELVRQS